MTIDEYLEECRRLSDDFGEKKRVADQHLVDHPGLPDDESYEKYWDLQNAATTAAINWQRYCDENRSRVKR